MAAGMHATRVFRRIGQPRGLLDRQWSISARSPILLAFPLPERRRRRLRFSPGPMDLDAPFGEPFGDDARCALFVEAQLTGVQVLVDRDQFSCSFESDR